MSEVKQWKYKNQLVFYKILVENSRAYHGKYQVHQGILEFIQPDDDGEVIELSCDITDADMTNLKKMVEIVYEKIVKLDFPTVDRYEMNMKGILEFQKDLLMK